ncbi:MAG: amidohydrolase family protein [Pseudomonadota bacterium]
MKTRRKFLRHSAMGAAVLSAPGWLSSCATSQVPAQLVLTNGEIHTVDAMNQRVAAMAVQAGRIIATGSDQDISAWIGPHTRVINLDGRTVLPGINDSHLHLLMWAMGQPPYALDMGLPSIQACVAEVARAVDARKPGEWIVGRGWDQPYFAEGRAPTAADLDAVAPDNPVVLTDFSGHAVWVNSMAMRLVGIDENSVPPEGGVIVKDAAGKPTGVLFEVAAWEVRRAIPEPGDAERKTALRAAMQRMLERGVTSCTIPGQSPEILQLLNDVAAETSNPARLRMTGLVRSGASHEGLLEAMAGMDALPAGDPMWMQVPGVKIMGDGIPTANKTAWLLSPYVGGGNGHLLINGNTDADRVVELNKMIDTIHAAGLQIGTHVTGDQSVDVTVAAYRKVQAAGERQDPRHYLIHADLVSETTLAQMAVAGIGGNFNPEIKHMIADGQVYALGPERAAYEWPYRSALDAGVVVASSSDAPVTPGNWLQGIATCMNRIGKQTGKVSGPEQRITLDESIRTYTWAGAWQDHAESYKGTLEPGKVADFCVLDERLSTLDSTAFADVDVALTAVDGVVVHDRLA